MKRQPVACGPGVAQLKKKKEKEGRKRLGKSVTAEEMGPAWR